MNFATAALMVIFAATLYGSLLAVLVLILLKITERRLPARWRFALWLLVLIRLSMIPLPESRLSLFNLLPERPSSTVPRAHASVVATPGLRPVPRFAFSEGSVQSPALAVTALDQPGHLATVPAAPAPIPAPPFSILHFLFSILPAVYVVGLAVILLRLLLATLALRSILRTAQAASDPPLLASLNAARASLHIRRPLPLLLTGHLASPALVGLFKPRLLLPCHLLSACSRDDLHFIFLHECAHLGRRDILLNYWLALVSALHWFNPLVWLLLPRIKADRELAADELVLLHTSAPASYGHTLLKVLENANGPRSPRSPALIASAAVSILESNSKSFFKRRIQMIANYRRTPAWLAFPAFGALLLFAAATLTTAITKAADPAGAKPASPAPVESVPAATPIDFSPDALLKREIQKLADFKKTITGDTDDDKLMRDELDYEMKSIGQFVGAPYPPGPENSPHSTPRYRGPSGRPAGGRIPAGGFPGGGPVPAKTPADHAEQLLSDLWRKENADADFHVDKQPLASVIQGIQERLYKSFWMDYAYDGDPRPNIVNAYRMNRITLDWKALESAGVHPETLVSVDSSKYAGAILQDLLSSLKAAGASIQVVNNSGEYGIRLDIQTRVTYNVRDLLAPTNSARAGGRPISGNPDDLIKGIRLTCSPDWWKKAPDDAILQFKGLVTITTTLEIHEQIKAYLKTLRKADREDAEPGKAAALEIRPAPHAGEDGEFYVMGDVTRSGVYSASGRRITLKQAVVAAGLKTDPQTSSVTVTLTRREPENKEDITKIDLKAIFDGTEPDCFLQPNDILKVAIPAGGEKGGSASSPKPMPAAANEHGPAEFPRVVPFDLGDSQFLSGDRITITEIRGTSEDFALNNSYQIKGTYALASHDHAKLAVYVTSGDAHDTHHDPYDDRQTVLIDKGTGTFTLVLPLLSKGYPHVSFYPVEGGQSFSAVYFGGGDAMLKAKGVKP